MTHQQLYLAVGVPLVFNAALIGFLMAWANAKFDGVDLRFAAIEKRLDDLKDAWRAELHRVEEILDARWKHLEGRL